MELLMAEHYVHHVWDAPGGVAGADRTGCSRTSTGSMYTTMQGPSELASGSTAHWDRTADLHQTRCRRSVRVRSRPRSHALDRRDNVAPGPPALPKGSCTYDDQETYMEGLIAFLNR